MTPSATDKPRMSTLHNAAENASTSPVTDAAIVGILRDEGGNASHVRAVFGDASLAVLALAGRSNGIDLETILAAYATARRTVATANPELNEALRGE